MGRIELTRPPGARARGAGLEVCPPSCVLDITLLVHRLWCPARHGSGYAMRAPTPSTTGCRLACVIALMLAAAALAWPRAAGAVFPGATGKLVLGYGIYEPPNPNQVLGPGLALGGNKNMRWSPDGSRLAGSGPSGTRETGIRVVDSDGQNARVLTTPGGGASDDLPAWSPSGQDIAFVRTTPGLRCGTSTCNGYALLVVNVTTGALRTVLPTQGGRFVANPDWSPDGSRIVAHVFDFGAGLPGGIELVDAASGARTPLPALGRYNFPRFSPDGQEIVAGRSNLAIVDGGGIRRIKLDGTVVEDFDRVATGGGTQPTFTPDGRWVSFVDCRPDCAMWSRRVLRSDDLPGTPISVRRDVDLLGDDGRQPDWQPIPAAVQILTAPAATIGEQAAVFAFSLAGGDEPAGEYRCRLEGPQPSDWVACTSPRSYGTLPEGSYTFSVRFVLEGRAAEDFPITRRSFIVDRTPPSVSIDERPPERTESRDVTIRFSSSAADGVTFRCRLNGGAEYDCSSPQRLASLALGRHSFAVVARDAVGNASRPVVVAWEVVESPPVELPAGETVVAPPAPPPPPLPGGLAPPAAPPQPSAADRVTCGQAGGTVTIGVLTAISLGQCFAPTLIGGRLLNATSAPVKVNGMLLTPRGATKIVVDARMSSGVVRWTGPVRFSIGAWSLDVSFSAGLPVTRTSTEETTFTNIWMKRLEDEGKLKFAGLGFAAEPTFKLSKDDGGTTKIALKLSMPAAFQGLPGAAKADEDKSGGLSFEIGVSVANTKAPSLSARATIQRAYLFGKLQLEDISLAVDSGPPLTFEGSGKLKLVPYNFKGFDKGANVELSIGLGEGGGFAGLRKLAVQAADIQKPLGYGIFLQRLGGEFAYAAAADGAAAQWTLSSNAGLSFGPKLEFKPVFEGEAASLDGKITLNWGTDFTVRGEGKGAIVTVPVGESKFNWQPSKGRVDLEGNLTLDVGGYGFKGAISDAFFETAQDARPRLFNVQSRAQLLLDGQLAQLEGTAETVLSEKGYAACYGDENSRFGLAGSWRAERIEVFVRSCDVGPYRSAGAKPRSTIRGAARAAQAPAQTFTVARASSLKVIALTGVTSAPRVQLTDPRGAVVDASRGSAVDNERAIVVADDARRVTHIVLRDPPAGTWTISPLAGLEAPVSVQTADELAPVAVSGRSLSRRDGRRLLRWKLAPIAGQQVSFVERAGDTATPITTTTAATGSVVYTPTSTAPLRRTIEAIVTQDGRPRTRRTLTNYRVTRAPLRRVGAIARRGAHLSWRARPGLATYAVYIRTPDNTTFSLRTRRNRIVLPAKARRVALLTRIVTITGDGRVSSPTTRRIAAPKRAATTR